jgi:hypothetical protein
MTSTALAETDGVSLVAITDAVSDPFDIAFRPAKQTLDAVILMTPHLRWLDQRRRSGLSLFEPARAAELVKRLPTSHALIDAGALFTDAELEPAPEGWVHIAVGLMLDERPSAASVPDAYRCAIADGMYRDDDAWGGYGPGFSCAAVVRAIRGARRLEQLPSPGKFLAMCAKHRRQFRQWSDDVDVLTELRYRVEDFLEEQNRKRLPAPEPGTAMDDGDVWSDLGYRRA